MARAVAFPGQGSQRKGMGHDLFARYPELTARAGRILGYDVPELCQEHNQRLLRQTRYLQPTLFVIGALGWLRHTEDHPGAAEPDYLLGHSLGEYTALFAAGSLAFDDGVRLVRERALCMAQVPGGGMLAVVGLGIGRLREALEAAGAADVDVANHNAPEQTVLSGPEDTLRDLVDTLKAAGADKCVLLHISIAAHSRYMAPAAERFAEALRAVRFEPPRVPVIANVTAEPYPPGAQAQLLTRHFCSGVRWWDSLAYLRGHGVDELTELGPGSVLTKLWAIACDRLPLRSPRDTPDPAAAAPAVTARTAAVGPVAAQPEAPRRAGARTATAHPVAPRPAAARAAAVNPGSASFRARYALRRAYVAGATGAGGNGVPLVAATAARGTLAVLEGAGGAGGLRADLAAARQAVGPQAALAVRLPPPGQSRTAAVDACLEYGVDCVEVDDPAGPDPDVIRFRFHPAESGPRRARAPFRQVLAAVPDPVAARRWLAPPGDAVLRALLTTGGLASAAADAARALPVATDLCVETGSGWCRDPVGPAQLLPAVRSLAHRSTQALGSPEPVHVGAGDAIGTPESAAAAFALGADFVVTRSINLTTRQSRLSPAAAALLAGAAEPDFAWAPRAAHHRVGARVRVLRRGTLFPARANRLWRLHRLGGDLADLDPRTRERFERTLDASGDPNPGDLLDRYLAQSLHWAVRGDPDRTSDYQLPCGPESVAFRRAAERGGGPCDPRPDAGDVADWLLDRAAALLAR